MRAYLFNHSLICRLGGRICVCAQTRMCVCSFLKCIFERIPLFLSLWNWANKCVHTHMGMHPSTYGWFIIFVSLRKRISNAVREIERKVEILVVFLKTTCLYTPIYKGRWKGILWACVLIKNIFNINFESCHKWSECIIHSTKIMYLWWVCVCKRERGMYSVLLYSS